MFSRTVWRCLIAVCIVVTGLTVISNAVSMRELAKLPDIVISHPVPPIVQPPAFWSLPAATWVPQTFNNCGPAATSMVLQYFGYQVSQEVTKSALRTSPNDTNVFAPEVSDFLKHYGISSKLFVNGDIPTLKSLVANGFYVVVENWLRPNEDIGHFIIIRGYDDDKKVLIADDSYFGVGIPYPYDQFEKTQWNELDYEFMPVWKGNREAVVQAIVGTNWDQTAMYKNAVKRNEAIVKSEPNNMFAWFNLGTAHFALSELHQAEYAFEQSRSLGWPMRMLWYQIQPVQTYNKIGEFDKALELSKIGLQYNDAFDELLLEEAIAYKGLDQLDNATIAVHKALQSAPNFQPALEFAKNL